MLDFEIFSKQYGPLISSITKQAYSKALEGLSTNFELYPHLICSAVHSAFFHICKSNKALHEAGFEVYGDINHRGELNGSQKVYLYYSPENCILRFGKMKRDGKIAKCTTKADKKFASQDNSLLDPEFCNSTNLHIGYIETKNGLELEEVFITYPIGEKTNKYIWRMSETNQPLLFDSEKSTKQGLKAFLTLNNTSHKIEKRV